MVGAGAAVDFIASLAGGATRRERLRRAFEALHTNGAALASRLWEGLSAIPGVTVFGPPAAAPRTSTLAFVVKKVTSTEVARRLAELGTFVSHGDCYAQTVVERLGGRRAGPSRLRLLHHAGGSRTAYRRRGRHRAPSLTSRGQRAFSTARAFHHR
jgi:selenocysteine lyase/cysteine desulfurase